jgi:hypothetical protein
MNSDGGEAAAIFPYLNELETLVAERAGWRDADDIPESLFHYTSSTAFLNI